MATLELFSHNSLPLFCLHIQIGTKRVQCDGIWPLAEQKIPICRTLEHAWKVTVNLPTRPLVQHPTTTQSKTKDTVPVAAVVASKQAVVTMESGDENRDIED
ncbi:hypothetical protein B0H14DRAFT_2555106 [Mycena olivaceomarginata]|nr:hypothetical protein B0H14DRAFT_2555106 [Mycena olivaceomarginata]